MHRVQRLDAAPSVRRLHPKWRIAETQLGYPNGADTIPGIAQRRKHNAPERRRLLADAAIELLGAGGARGLSHPKVDAHASVPAGTTSFYFRTRHALLLAVAERLTELDVQDLSRLTELTADGSGRFSGTAGLAELVMYSAGEPFLTRTKARYELALHSGRDAELADALKLSVETFYRLAQDIVTGWHRERDTPPAGVIHHQARAVLALINGVMLSFVAGRPIVESTAQLELLLDGLIAGLSAHPDPTGP